MKVFFYVLFILSLLMLTFNNSYAQVFSPTNLHQIVSPNKKGSLQLTGGFSDTYVRGDVKEYPAPLERFAYGVQLGYSPIEHLAVIANFIRPNYIVRPIAGDINAGRGGFPTSRTTGNTNAYYGYQTDLAIGAYWKTTKQGAYLKKRNKALFDYTNEWLFDAYAGGGKGHMFTNYSIKGSKEIRFNLYYIQGGVHWKNGKVSVDVVQRLIGTGFKEFNFLGNLFEDDLELAKELSTRPFRLASRTAVRLNVGPAFGKVYLEGNWSSFAGEFERFYFDSERFTIGFMLELDACFQTLKKR